MKITKLFKYICFLAPAIAFISGALIGSVSDSEKREEPVPRFILSGTQAANDTNFIYYSINDGTEYAVALTKTGKGLTSITIDDEYNHKPVTGIWRYGFANSQATSITIPESITVIDFEAFMNCKITSVTIPASVGEIGEGAFYACKAMTKVTIQNTTTSTASSSACMCDTGSGGGSGTPSELKVIPSFCFYNCNSLKELVLPESIEEVGYEAFNGCRQLYSTIAFSSITTIRSRAFQGCAALKKVYISSSFFEKEKDEYGDPVGEPIGIIEDKAFDGCNTNLKFYLVGDTTVVERWLYLHRDNRWRWKNETTNPDATSSNPQDPDSAIYVNCYEYEITAAGASYTNDWIYTTANNGEVTIASYIGPTEIEVEVDGNPVMQPIKLINFPNELPSGSGNPVVRINVDALTSVQANLERVYFPTTLKRIESRMFDNYPKLVVVDDNTGSCSDDDSAGANIDKRIILNGLTSLEVIGNSAFVNMGKLTEITKLYLPYSLIVVGNNAFGYANASNGKHMQSVTDFRWEYNESLSRLEAIGGGAFYAIGRKSASKLVTSGDGPHQGRFTGLTENYKLTTLVFPRTFKQFGITTYYKEHYELGSEEADDANFGANAFAGSPLISEVVFKGSTTDTLNDNPSINTPDTETENLVIPNQTFVLNESLRTVVFEERCGRSILFHTAGRQYLPAIGWSSGKRANDFSGDPGIQTIVLPNKYTTIRMQQYAMQGNSRAVVYLSNTNNTNFKGCSEASCKTLTGSITTGNVDDLKSDGKWRLIGDEGFDTTAGTYPGYCFANRVNDKTTDTYNKFNLSQYMPVYESVLYNQSVSVSTGKTETPVPLSVSAFVGLGNANEFIISRKCAYVTSGNDATMTKFLYDRYDTSFTGTAVVSPTVTKTGGNTCTVRTIGSSAFSAAYCDEAVATNYQNDTDHKDLVAVAIPNTIKTIKDYAFMRAYGVRSLYAYNPANYNANAIPAPRISDNYYVMPTALTSVGKHAFAFCNIEQFLRIPTNCSFYDTTSDAKYDTSVFSNNFSLRKITFGESDATSTTRYETTTYTTKDGTKTYTSALYSTNHSDVSKNKSSLLLVLNRDTNDYLCESSFNDLKDVSKKTKIEIVDGQEKSIDYIELDGKYKGTYIYGAFKMCYWIDSLVVGTPTTNNLNENQPLISGIYDVSAGKDKYLYLNTANDFSINKDYCNLESVTFDGSLDTPNYSFEGCGKLKYVTLPRIEGGEIPSGLFSLVSNSGMQFRVPRDATGINFRTCDPGELDLTWTAYSKICADAFRGTQINTLIAPKPWDDDDPNTDNNPNTFTIEQDAFRGCEKLALIDFSNVTGRVVINAAFRGSTTAGDITKISNNLFNFGTTAKIEFGAEAFKGATFTGDKNDANAKKTFTFPVNTAIIGTSCFEECSTLQKVTALGVLTELEPVAADTASGKNNDDIGTLFDEGHVSSSAGFKQIGDYAFFHCNNLVDFDFSKFEGVERIGNGAFSMVQLNGTVIWVDENNNKNIANNNATICTGGIVNLPASITNIGFAAFYGSMVTDVTINSSTIRFERGNSKYTSDTRSKLSNYYGSHAFRWCTKLTEVYFSNPDCEWRQIYMTKAQGGQENIFSNCGKLEKVFLPCGPRDAEHDNVLVGTGFNIQPSIYKAGTDNDKRPDSMMWKSYGSLDVYVYHTVNDIQGSPREPNPIINDYWHRMNDGVIATIVYYAGTDSDVVLYNNSTGKYELIVGGKEYWTMKNGVPVYLGTAAVDETTGAITFSESVTLNSLTYAKNGGASTSLSYDPLNDSVRASTSITVAVNDVITVSLNGNALKYGLSGNDTSFTATTAGTYTLVVNGSDRFFITDTTSVVIQENSETITEREIDLTQENSVTLAAVPTPGGATDEKIWSSSDPSVATVSNLGVVTPVSAGTTRITVYMGASSAYVDVTVKDYCVMTINSTPTRVTSYNASNATHAQQNITLAVDDEVSVTLNGDSLYYGAEGSETTFTATTAGNYVLVIDNDDRFYVTCDATAVEINEGASHTLHIGTDLSYQLTTTLTPTNATNTLVWSSTDNSVATVSDSGLVTPVSAGTATIAVLAGNASDTIEITVVDPYCVLTYGETEVELDYDVSSNTVRAQVELELEEDDVVSITLNDVNLKYGLSGNNTSFTVPADGTYNIIINGDNRFFYIVDAEEVDIQENSVSISTRTMYVGDADATLVAVISPEHSTDEATWTSSDDDIATVDSNGVVHAVGRGTATITATAGSVSDSVTVDVHTYYSLLAGGNEYLLNNHKGSGETEEYYSDIIELDENDTVQILYDGDTPTEGAYSRNTADHNNLGAGGIVNGGEVEVYANKYTKQIWVTGYARITYNGTSYIAERENDTSYYIDVDLTSDNTITAGSIGSSDLTASLSVDTGTGNNIKDVAGTLTIISTSENARIYLHSDGKVWVTGLALEDSFKLIYGTNGGSEATWSYGSGVTGSYLSSEDVNVESQAEFVVTLSQINEFKLLDANGNYLGADIAESPYTGAYGANIAPNCPGEYHVYLKKYNNGSYGIAVAVEQNTITMDLASFNPGNNWTSQGDGVDPVIYAYVWEGSDSNKREAWFKASSYTSLTINGHWTNMILVRKNGHNDTPNWDGKYNQTGDLTIQYGKTLTITGWDNGPDGKSGVNWAD